MAGQGCLLLVISGTRNKKYASHDQEISGIIENHDHQSGHSIIDYFSIINSRFFNSNFTTCEQESVTLIKTAGYNTASQLIFIYNIVSLHPKIHCLKKRTLYLPNALCLLEIRNYLHFLILLIIHLKQASCINFPSTRKVYAGWFSVPSGGDIAKLLQDFTSKGRQQNNKALTWHFEHHRGELTHHHLPSLDNLWLCENPLN